MPNSKRIINLFLMLTVIISMFASFTISASAKETGFYRATTTAANNGKLSPVWNKVLYLAGKKTYKLQTICDRKGLVKAAGADPNTVKKLRFDITVINADGSKSLYYGKTAGFNFKLPKNRTYKVYITSYTSDYKTYSYGTKAAALAVNLKYNLKY